MTRRRLRLVPKGGVEVFEVRAVLYFEPETGQSMVVVHVSEPDGTEAVASCHEVLGVLRMAELLLVEQYDSTDLD